MKKDFTVECWLFNQRITAQIVVHDLRVYCEYHPLITSCFYPIDLKNYFFMSNYDGSLELNRAPKDELSALLLKELSDAILTALKPATDSVIYPATYFNRLPGDSPSAAA